MSAKLLELSDAAPERGNVPEAVCETVLDRQ